MHHDPPLVIDAIANDTDFVPKEEVAYEVFLIRAQIAADPIDELAFAIDRVVEKKYHQDYGWHTPKVQL